MPNEENSLSEPIARQEMTNAQEGSSNAASQMNDFMKEARGYTKDLFFRISVLSGASLSLSVTFIGYLINSQLPMKFPAILLLGWAMCIISMICGVLRNYFYVRFGHWQVLAEWVKEEKEATEAELNIVVNYPASAQFSGGQTHDEAVSNMKKNIRTLDNAVEHNKRKESFNNILWRASEISALAGFTGGITLIVIFAAVNLFGETLVVPIQQLQELGESILRSLGSN